VTASDDNTARLWDAVSGKAVGEPMRHEDTVNSAQFSPDGQRVVTASFDKTARLWDAVSGKPIAEPMRHEAVIFSAQFSPDGQRVVTASLDKTARLWDAVSGKPIAEPMRHEAVVFSAQFSPDGQRVVTASYDNTARLWDAASGKPIGEPIKHGDTVFSAQFSPDGERVVTASKDRTAGVWDATSGEPIGGESMKHEEEVYSAQFSPNGQRVVAVSRDKTAQVRDAAIMTDKDTRKDILLLAELAKATSGVTLETVGQAENLKLLAPEQVRASREKVAAKFLLGVSSKLTPLQRVMKWSVSDRRRRTISPFSEVTVSEWLENSIKEGTVESLRAAMQFGPANARVTAYLGRCLATSAVEQVTDPDEARRARGEADFLTSRAEKLAPDSDEIKKLRDEVVNLINLPQPTTKVFAKALRGPFGVWIDPQKWTQDSSEEDPVKISFNHKTGDAYAIVISERIGLTTETLKNAAVANAKKVMPDVKIVSEEKRVVKGKELLCLKLAGTLQGTPFIYYGYYYGGSEGTLQVVTATASNIFDEFKQDFDDFLNGTQILQPLTQ
jgi:dipeptidyl aminopeptidase/acylaminoacyl peptidase